MAALRCFGCRKSIDDKTGKPIGINEAIGRRPIAAFGNSDGDLQMLQWTTLSGGVRLGVIVQRSAELRKDSQTGGPRRSTRRNVLNLNNFPASEVA